MNTDWRRIDIDAFDSDSRLTAEDLQPPYDHQITIADLQNKIQQLRNLSSSGDFTQAIKLITQDPPYSGDENTKEQYFQNVLEVLIQVRQADMSNIISSLNSDEQIVLIKYLYKGMSKPNGQKNGGALLTWFDKLTQVTGVTPIVHYLTDRRTV